jgi:hypothetical protein
MRLISTDALIKLVQLKEGADGPETGRKIRSLLAPMEYTRLDQMVDVMFTTAKDVESAAGAEVGKDEGPAEEEAEADKAKSGWDFTDAALLQAKREQIVSALSGKEGVALIRRSRALFWNADHHGSRRCDDFKAVCQEGRSILLVCLPSSVAPVPHRGSARLFGLGLHGSGRRVRDSRRHSASSAKFA